MADRLVVEQLTREMAVGLQRPVKGPDFAAAVDTYCRHFRDVSDDEFAAAVTRWQETIEDPWTLPAVRTLRSLMSRAATPVADRLAEAPWVPPRAEFVEAHLRFRDRVNGRKNRARGRHDHEGESCRECDAMRAGWDELAALVWALPEPVEGSARDCRCDGSGWVDTAGSWAAVHAVGADEIRDSLREVFPCPVCNRALFDAWQEGRQTARGAA